MSSRHGVGVCLSERRVLAYLAGLAGPAERARARAHLAGCEACRAAAVLCARLFAEETREESAALDAVEARSAAAAREIVRERLSRTTRPRRPRNGA